MIKTVLAQEFGRVPLVVGITGAMLGEDGDVGRIISLLVMVTFMIAILTNNPQIENATFNALIGAIMGHYFRNVQEKVKK